MQRDDLWEHFDQKITESATVQIPQSSATVIVKQYLDLPYLARKEDPLQFWEQRKKVFSNLHKIALKYLCIPATSVLSERVFSKAGLVCNQRRNRLESKKLDQIIFLNSS